MSKGKTKNKQKPNYPTQVSRQIRIERDKPKKIKQTKKNSKKTKEDIPEAKWTTGGREEHTQNRETKRKSRRMRVQEQP